MMPLFPAFEAGRKAGFVSVVLGVMVGLVSAFVCFWGLWGVLVWFPEKLGLSGGTPTPRVEFFRIICGYFVCCLGLLRVVLLCLFASWLSTFVIQL